MTLFIQYIHPHFGKEYKKERAPKRDGDAAARERVHKENTKGRRCRSKADGLLSLPDSCSQTRYHTNSTTVCLRKKKRKRG